jgi:hypothetical protein
MQSFVAWHGQIPPEATRVEEHEAERHAVAWLRRHIGGRGCVHSYVIGYVLRERWWSLFFQRTSVTAADGAEQWWIEAYDHNGKSWSESYYYSLEGRWRRTAHALGAVRRLGGNCYLWKLT